MISLRELLTCSCCVKRDIKNKNVCHEIKQFMIFSDGIPIKVTVQFVA